MKSTFKFIIPVAILLMLFGILWRELSANRANHYEDGMVGDTVPAFSVPALSSNETLSNKNFNGKVVILNFFASWCGACREEHPTLMKIKNDYHIPIYGIAFRDEPNDTRTQLQQDGNPYKMVGYDIDGKLGVDFGIYATPETFVISPSGKIIYKHVGILDDATFTNKIIPLIKKYQS